ncbi:hypothetical protein Syun_002521 [Stephania yunnanensis]|uniref:Glycine-rich protein n=1 Tax=Stephania yunnanensis TaxID=152371 RepID=A0AAP0QBX0_9MAGN
MGIRAKAGLLVFLIIILSSLLHISATSHHVSGNVVEKHALPSRNGHLVSVQRKGGGGGRGGGGGGRGAGGRPFIAGTAGGAAGAGLNRHERGAAVGIGAVEGGDGTVYRFKWDCVLFLVWYC